MPTVLTLTTRHSLAPAGSRVSLAPYDDFNLGDHVGDDPAAVERNRSALAARLGLARPELIFMNQVHGADVAIVDGPLTGPPPAVDALVTATPGLGLVVLVADCIPLLLADETAGVVAAVHAGRRGVQLGVAAVAVAAMRSLGARDIRARLGPHIGSCCYEVGSDVQAEVIADVACTAALTTDGRPALDLGRGLRSQLAEAGVTRISTDPACTFQDDGLFSYRREGTTGRFAGIAQVTS